VWQSDNLKSGFLGYMLESNRAEMKGFKKWLFQPGMLFNSRETWWGEKKPRRTPHEGLDLCFFEDAAGRIKKVDGKINIPATFAGEIVKISRDFLGKSIYLSHEIFSQGRRQLYTIYGHTKPFASLKVGDKVAKGEIFATIAAQPKKSFDILPHLHLTFAWIPLQIHPDRLNWLNLGRDGAITLIDPLSVLLSPV